MPSHFEKRSNRCNAQKSTGPRSSTCSIASESPDGLKRICASCQMMIPERSNDRIFALQPYRSLQNATEPDVKRADDKTKPRHSGQAGRYNIFNTRFDSDA